jgi:hypothetical protein
MTQLTLFETAHQAEINLTDDVVAVCFHGRWEIYVYDYTLEADRPRQGVDRTDRAIPRFSHFATPAEALACWFPKSAA